MKINRLLLYSTIILFNLFSACNKDNDDPVPVVACFGYNYVGDEFGETYVEFSNCSENATSYLWDFGDNASSTEENPVHYYSEEGVFVVNLTAYNEENSDIITDTIHVNWLMLYKPNIYLYPDKNIDICVNLEFPQGGQVVKSIPAYNDEWCVHIDTSGIIDNEYEYLFYESIQPDLWQYEKGWCVKKDSLLNFFESNMKSYNFSEKEIEDFTSYWIPILTDDEYYNIYPQRNETINEVIQLNFSIQPDHVFRLFYGVIGTSSYTEIPAPETDKIKRDGFSVVEWGVFRK